MTYPSSAGVIASTLRPKRWKYQAVDPMAKTDAPMGRALFLKEAAAPSAEKLDVDAARYMTQFVSFHVHGRIEAPRQCEETGDGWQMLAATVGWRRVWGCVPKLSCWWHCELWRRPSAPYAVLIEPTCCGEAGSGRGGERVNGVVGGGDSA
jgi:hypothetical protein